ncbi:hypothetical protein J2X67_002427 [Variovorax sp. 3319]|nr:hypothetical protein [Variovorax sp. 3319]MDR6887901.1 hypothetical protein [Variovorax sp. 3319]
MGSVSESPQFPKSRSTPAEQVGKQIEGGFGWRASAGNGGRCAGSTDGGAEGGELCAHPALSSASTISIVPSTGNLFLTILNHSIDASAPGLFVGTGGPFSQAAGFGLRGAVVGEILLCRGGISVCASSTGALNAGRGQGAHESDTENPQQRRLEVGQHRFS